MKIINFTNIQIKRLKEISIIFIKFNLQLIKFKLIRNT